MTEKQSTFGKRQSMQCRKCGMHVFLDDVKENEMGGKTYFGTCMRCETFNEKVTFG